MKKNDTPQSNGQLKKTNPFYKLAFSLLALAGFVAVPVCNIAGATDCDVLQTISTISAVVMTVAGGVSAYIGDKKEKQLKEEIYEKE